MYLRIGKAQCIYEGLGCIQGCRKVQMYLRRGAWVYPRILEGSNVSKEEDLDVSKDLGRLPPRLICRLPDSCLATGRHHGSEARCHHHISFIIIVIRMRLSIFLMKKKREAFHIFDWQNLQQVFSAAIHTEYKTDFKFDVFVVKIFDC